MPRELLAEVNKEMILMGRSETLHSTKYLEEIKLLEIMHYSSGPSGKNHVLALPDSVVLMTVGDETCHPNRPK
jgi:hypothetical protein